MSTRAENRRVLCTSVAVVLTVMADPAYSRAQRPLDELERQVATAGEISGNAAACGTAPERIARLRLKLLDHANAQVGGIRMENMFNAAFDANAGRNGDQDCDLARAAFDQLARSLGSDQAQDETIRRLP